MLDSDSVQIGHSFDSAVARVRPVAQPFAVARSLGLACVVSLALVTRLAGLGAVSFSEDEINKLRAVEAYDRGDITANAEHPMVMKLSMWASHRAARSLDVSPEAALRFPNAAAGAATTAVVFLLAEQLFDATVGGWAALLWAVDVNAAAINRIGKEDTFLVFFLLLASYCYERGKTAARFDPVSRDRWYLRSAASFGAMMASKYMPYYFGLHALFNVAADDNPADTTPDKRRPFYLVMLAVFGVANVALALPGTWRYLAGYIQGDTLRHTGYHFAHRVYLNTVGMTPWGLPWTFYLTFFATKVSFAVLAAAIGGLAWAARHPSHRGATFLRVFLLLTLLPYSLVASKFLRYMLPVLAIVDIAGGVGVAWLMRRLDAVTSVTVRQAMVAACAVCLVMPPMMQLLSVGPYYGLAQNAIGARIAPRGSLFPDDEIYDAGVREAVAAVAATARRGAVVCSDATAVVAEYLARNGRSDVTSCSISHDGLPMRPVETWVIVQDSHTYFENEAVIDGLRRRLRPWLDVRLGGISAVQVFRFQ